jgi:hypothetical protein
LAAQSNQDKAGKKQGTVPRRLKFNFDSKQFKQFLIRKGERIAFGLAMAIMLWTVVASSLSLARGKGSAANTRLLSDLNSEARTKMVTSKPSADVAALPPDLLAALAASGADLIDPDLFTCDQPFFSRDGQADRKWRRPKVLAPVEFTAEIMRGGIESYLFVMGEDKMPKQIAVLAQHDTRQDLNAAVRMQGIFANYSALSALSGVGSRGLAGGGSAELASGGAAGGMGAGGGRGGGGGGGTPPIQRRGNRGHGAGAAGPAARGGGEGSSEGGGGTGGNAAEGGDRGSGSAGGGSGSAGGGFGGTPQGRSANLLRRSPLRQEGDLKFISVDEFVQKPSGRRLARTVIPTRMAIISGSFPYRAQLEEYRSALHFDSIESMLNDPGASPEFLGMQVQRRTVTPEREPVTDWEDLDIETPIKQLKLASTGSQRENDEFLRYGIIVYPNRLVMPRPKLIRHESYPEERLRLLAKTILDLKKPNVVALAPPPKTSIFDREIDVWSDTPVIGGEGNSAAGPGSSQAAANPAPVNGGAAAVGRRPGGRGRFSGGEFSEGDEADMAQPRGQAATRVPPEYCLFRFLDVTIEPGQTYEYRIKVAIANPSYNQPERALTESVAREPALVADDWTVASRNPARGRDPLLVSVPDDLEFYAINEIPGAASDSHKRKTMEIHRWLDVVQVNPMDRASVMPVGAWSILPRTPVSRGEYLGHTVEMPVPVWKPTVNGFVFATPPEDEVRQGAIKRTIRHSGVSVDFATDPLSEIGAGPILVDFDGGKLVHPADPKTVLADLPWDVLVYTADNKLVLRNSASDTTKPVRLARVNEWEQWLKETAIQSNAAKAGAGRDAGGGGGRRRGGP